MSNSIDYWQLICLMVNQQVNSKSLDLFNGRNHAS